MTQLNATLNIDNDRLLTKKDIQKLTGYSLPTVDRWMKLKMLPYVKIDKGVRFLPADLQKLIKSHRVGR